MNDHAHGSFDQVLAIHPTTSGFGWVLFEAATRPIEWGTASVANADNVRCLERIRELIERFRPTEIVLEQFEGKPARRKRRIVRLSRSIVELARLHGVEPSIFTREAIEQAFAKFGAKDRYQIATVIAGHIEPLAHLLPPKRKIWLPESRSMGLFNAAALAITFFALIDGAILPS
jgi:hypothetical protein